jgi:hypothetical protein
MYCNIILPLFLQYVPDIENVISRSTVEIHTGDPH